MSDARKPETIKRAGGVSGFVDEESWWEKRGSCAAAAMIIRSMTALERVSLLNHPDVRPLVDAALDEVKAEWARRDAENVPRLLVERGKTPRKRTMRPYWMRTVEGVDMSRRGSERLVGDWVFEPDETCDPGELVVVGLRYPEKIYALCRVTKGETADLFVGVRPDLSIKGLVSLGEWTSFSEFIGVCEKELLDGG